MTSSQRQPCTASVVTNHRTEGVKHELIAVAAERGEL